MLVDPPPPPPNQLGHLPALSSATTVRALKPPYDTPPLCIKQPTICTYDLYSSMHNVLDAWISSTWASGRGLGRVNCESFGPQMALAYRLAAISQGPKTL
jgi:hypothetical protein